MLWSKCITPFALCSSDVYKTMILYEDIYTIPQDIYEIIFKPFYNLWRYHWSLVLTPKKAAVSYDCLTSYKSKFETRAKRCCKISCKLHFVFLCCKTASCTHIRTPVMIDMITHITYVLATWNKGTIYIKLIQNEIQYWTKLNIISFVRFRNIWLELLLNHFINYLSLIFQIFNDKKYQQ